MASKNPRKDKEVKRRDLYSTDELNKIRVVPGLNVRHDLLNIPELMGLIQASKRITPLLVRRNLDSDVEALWDLIGGHRRLEAAKRLMDEGWEGKVTLEEITCTEEEMFLYMALDNMGREDFSPVEEAEVVVRLERMGWTDADIVEKMGRSLPWVAERKALYTAAPEVKDEVRDGLPADVAADIAKSGGNEKQKQILAEAKAEAQKLSKKKGRKDWRQNMRRTVSTKTGRKMMPGKRMMRQVQKEMVQAIDGKEINGESNLALVAIDFALGEITVEQFRDEMGYEIVEVDE